MTIGLCGDLKFGRTVHSLIEATAGYKGVRFVLISPEELTIPSYIKKDVLDRNNVSYNETRSLEKAVPDLDILYMTRVQRERFIGEDDYERLKDTYILRKKMLESAKDDLVIMHPLPRVNEISVEVDSDRVRCGLRVRSTVSVCKVARQARIQTSKCFGPSGALFDY